MKLSTPSIRRVWVYFVLAIAVIIFIAASAVLYITARFQQKQLSTGPAYSATEYYASATEQIDKGDYASAETSLKQALQKEDSTTYRNQLAVVEYRLKKYADAITQYRALIDAGANASFAWNGIGNAYRDWAETEGVSKAEKQASAIDAYKKAITLDRQYVAAYSNEALLLASQGQKDQALAVLDVGISVTNEDALRQTRKTIAGT
jgi:tetratricopeptide (TPR) repeat protein